MTEVLWFFTACKWKEKTKTKNKWRKTLHKYFVFVSFFLWSLSQSCRGAWQQSIQGQYVFHVVGTEKIPVRGSELHSKLLLLSSKAMEALTFGNNWPFFPRYWLHCFCNHKLELWFKIAKHIFKNKLKLLNGFHTYRISRPLDTQTGFSIP